MAMSGEPSSVQIFSYFSAEARERLPRIWVCKSVHHTGRGMGQMRGSMRNCDRYFFTALRVGASGVPVLAMMTPTLRGAAAFFLLIGYLSFHGRDGRGGHELGHLAPRVGLAQRALG